MFESLYRSCMDLVGSAPNLYFGLFVAGLVGGVLHCSLQCGLFVASCVKKPQVANRSGAPLLQRLSGAALLPYHLGRMTTYSVLAALFALSLAGAPRAVVAALSPWLLLAAAAVFLVAALGALPRGGRAVWPHRGVITAFTRRLKPGSYGHGAAMGFLPCAMSGSALVVAGTAGTPLLAAFAMAAFGFGTLLALIPLAPLISLVRARLGAPPWLTPAFCGLCALMLTSTAGRLLLERSSYG